MRKTRSQTQAEAAMANAGRTPSTSNSPSIVSSTENSGAQNMSTSNRMPQNIQIAAVSAQKRIVQQTEHFKIKECEEMINLLRVVELQQILSFLNISFAGRKIDLQRRIINLLHTNYDLLSHKIREVYTQSIAEQQAQQYGPTDPKRMYSHMQMPQVQPNPAAGLPNAGQPTAVGAQPIAGVPPTGPGVANNMVPFMNPIPTHIPIHPDVRLKKLAFYDVLGVLIKPSSLVPRNTQRIQEVPFYFTLTPQQATEIASNRDIRNSNKIEHAIQVQLRFCLLETSCEQEDCFPPSVSVKVNNKLCQLPNVIPTNRPNVEPKRPPRPVNVTANVKLSPTVTNTITVQWCPDYTRGYCIAVYLVKKLTSAQLLHRMKTKGVKPADYTRGLIKEKLTEDADCEIATTMLKVSLNCPLGKMKMSIPCRASTCSHLQCFDASLYLQMNERKPTWNCPVCDKAAIYDNLVIDGYFQEVLASSLLKPDDTEIQLHKDGSWSTHSLRNEAQIIDTPTKPVEKVEVISDDIEVITTEDVKMVKAGAPPAIANDQPTSTTNSETVDLTLSDSDDDMPLAKRRPTIKQTSAASATNSAVSTSNINGSGNGNAAGNGGPNASQRNAFQPPRTGLNVLAVLNALTRATESMLPTQFVQENSTVDIVCNGNAAGLQKRKTSADCPKESGAPKRVRTEKCESIESTIVAPITATGELSAITNVPKAINAPVKTATATTNSKKLKETEDCAKALRERRKALREKMLATVQKLENVSSTTNSTKSTIKSKLSSSTTHMRKK
ncbi:E3 SUMO-protein ligase PIAS2 isoform X1 [Bactrocera dorsalis]|uniref:E3 SUMO-protein ligase PIAS2 isoform X1 n=3 Tax=Bactrocera dorsalis TaxID=27457 RepID=A0A6I9UUW2_BACDO|nr:E3 SUMO-protein ligase PIAS2 isoform X1 [Bactrocera dorsalis]